MVALALIAANGMSHVWPERSPRPVRYHCGRASHMQRNITPVVMAVVLGLVSTLSLALAQAAPTGTLIGHLAWCKTAPRPAGQADGEPSPLADVTPGLARH